MSKHALRLAGVVALTLLIAPEAGAAVSVVAPSADIAGQSQLDWAQAWWRWVLSVPAANNPTADKTGADSGLNNNGPVFFLAGNFGGVSTRTIDIPAGKPVFFPVVNSFFVPINLDGTYNPSPCASPLTLTCALQQVTPLADSAEDMSVAIDGISLTNAQVKLFRQTSASYFSVGLPDDNVLGVTPITSYDQCSSTGLSPNQSCANLWVQDGYYIALNGLSRGTYVLNFQGVIPGSSGINLNVTDLLKVGVPEPSTWVLMAIGFAGLGFAAHRARRRANQPRALEAQTAS